jgi:small-conductance mechanosensitive channel
MEDQLMASMLEFVTSNQFLLPLAILACSLVLGVIAEKLSLRLLKGITAKTKWGPYEAVRKGLRGMIVLLFVIGGMYIAIRSINISPTVLVYYHKTLIALIIATMTMGTARVSAGLVDLYVRRAEGRLPTTTILGNMLRIVCFVTGILVMLAYLDIPIAPIITALGIGGFAVALAFQDTLSNLFSGLHILASKQVSPGDYIMLDTGEEGYVTDVTWRNTTIRTLPKNMVVVPNSRLASATITNYCQPYKDMAMLIEVGVGYDSDLERVERVTIDVAREVLREVPGGDDSNDPFIRYHTFSEYRIDFTVILFVREFVDQYLVKHEFIKRLHERYRMEGIEIPLPVRAITFTGDRDELLTTAR